jgi:ubiquinone/menaquinone biosynthesis C-methylase UbiE
MSKSKWLALSAGLLAGVAVAGGWRVYSRRSAERIPSAEGLDDPAIAQAYGRVAASPQMALMRRLVAQRATALCSVGEAADIGCGTGLLATELARQAPDLHVTGVDLAAEMLAQAQEHAARMDMAGRVTFRLGNGNRLPFEDRSLDLAVSTLSLHHWADPVGVFNEIARVLRPGGAFLIADLRRDMPPPFYLLVWFATRVVVPPTLRRIGEPLASRNAAYDPYEVARLVQTSRLTGWSMATGPLWLTVEGKITGA